MHCKIDKCAEVEQNTGQEHLNLCHLPTYHVTISLLENVTAYLPGRHDSLFPVSRMTTSAVTLRSTKNLDSIFNFQSISGI